MKTISLFFIDNPVFAAVLSLLIVLAGSMAIFSLPITEYPDITPPEVTVKTIVAGATADVLEQTVAVPIEERVNGAKDMIYMSSRLSNDGSYTLQATFKPGSDPDIDEVEVQNRVLQAESVLPPYVVQNGIIVKKRTPTTLMMVSLYSDDNSRDSLYVSNYAQIHLLGPIIRSKGIGDYQLHGRTYAMRMWLKPDRMAALGVTADDVRNAVVAQNTQTPPGSIGASPATPGTLDAYNVVANDELTTPTEYEQMILRQTADGSVLRLGDVGRAELGARATGTFTDVNGLPGTSIQLFQLPGGNALKTVKEVRHVMDGLKGTIPPGMKYAVSLDTTLYVNQSITEVMKTFFIALVLVLVIVYLFLGTFRATVIPMAAVPVSLIGSVGVFAMLGFSINLLTLFGLVLAIGLVVDDAITVVEAVERHIEDGSDAKEAAKQAMQEVSRAILAIALVLSFVFIPIAFIKGITGSFYRQFALTLASSILLSAFVAVSLTPAMCAAFLTKRKEGKGPLAWITKKFEQVFDKLMKGYEWLLKKVIGHWGWGLAGLAVIIGCTVLLSSTVPVGFIPSEDQGYFYITLTMPDGTSLQRTEEISKIAEARLQKLPGVRYINTLGGYTFLEDADQPNTTTLIVDLEPWGKRKKKGMDAKSLMARGAAMLDDIPEAEVTPQAPASVPGLGGAGGFTFELQDKEGGTIQHLADAAETLSRKAAAAPELDSIYNTVRIDVPQVSVKVDRDKANSLGVPIDSIFNSLQIQLGGLIVNNFNRFGRIYKTMIQADAPYRSNPEGMENIYVRTSPAMGSQMMPLSNLVTLGSSSGPNVIQRFNMYRCIEISGTPAKGHSSGQALSTMEKLAQKIPPGLDYSWSGMAYQQQQAQGRSTPIFILALVFVYLVLAAQFESWLTPISVLIAIPTGALGVYLALWVAGLDNSIYAQVGLVTMIGLTAKNAVLIVEFATQNRTDGKDPLEAGLESSKLRFRPILMTSMAFILGMVPLVISTGAESVSRRTLGTAVLGGMLMTTMLTIFVTPMFWVAIESFAARRAEKKRQKQEEQSKKDDKPQGKEQPVDQKQHRQDQKDQPPAPATEGQPA